jgi:hypothetical protein
MFTEFGQQLLSNRPPPKSTLGYRVPSIRPHFLYDYLLSLPFMQVAGSKSRRGDSILFFFPILESI